MDLFGIKRRRAEREAQLQAEREAMLAARKTLRDHRKYLIDGWLKHDYDERYAKAVKNRNQDIAETEKKNTTCPVCGSKNRIFKFVRTKGELDGSLHGSHSGYSSLFGGSSYGSISGKIHGELDTLQVNECKDCGNQWEIAKPSHRHTDSYYTFPYETGSSGYVDYLWRRLNSIVEKNEWPSESNLRYGILSYFVSVPREVLESLIYEWYSGWDGQLNWSVREDKSVEYDVLHTHIYRDKNNKNFNDDKYLFQFSDEDWDLVKKVLKREEYVDFVYPVKDEDDD